ncbi:probable phenylalanine--tRNA ligase, mitochondrial [Gordionus sp. m RMFG-2023]|uniref:probable phenylalanine--tRNA ligase, mitochondrial n=1 Tax=Gordionus sp. m RMFG-2023 TaxID=3053472 RepID=UPI0031FBA895
MKPPWIYLDPPILPLVHMYNLLNTPENFIQFKEVYEKYASTLSSGIRTNKEISLRERIARDRLMGTGSSEEIAQIEDITEIQYLEIRWVDAYFPFTHPSWELEIKFENEYMEILGCGIMEQKILNQAGAHNKVGWAFGLGLERLAMLLYGIPDIRLFWSQDSGFLSQFKTDDCEKTIKMKPISKFPQCINDVSFWLPPNQELFDTNDFLEMIRNITSIAESEFDEIETMFDEPSTVLNDLMSNNRFKHSNNAKDSLAKKLVPKKDETCNNGGNKLAQERRIDIVEQVQLMDEYKDAKSGRISLCYRIIYRHPTKTLTKELVNRFHRKIEKALETEFDITLR